MRFQGSPGAAIVAGAGLLLALTALLAAPRAPEMPSVRFQVEVPDSLLLASAIAFGLAVVIVVAIAFSRDRRRQEAELLARDQEPSRRPWWLQALVRMLPLLPLLAMLVIFSVGWQYIESSWLAWSRFVSSPADLGAPTPEIPVVPLPLVGWLLGALMLLVALAMLAVALVLLFAERLAEWWERRSRSSTAEPLTEAVEESLDDLASEPDARAAIIKCYRRFERVAARARVPRAPWQTPEEFMRETLARLVVPRRAVDRLTRLFELARFSRHPLESPERDLARACLEEIRAALEREESPLGLA